MSDLLELASRCEAAEGADRLLDQAIAQATGWTCDLGSNWARETVSVWWRDAGGNTRDLPAFTASLDAAMTLVPEGYRFAGFAEFDTSMASAGKWTCSLVPRDHAHLTTYEQRVAAMGRADAATGPLALCAAALKARAVQ